MSFINRPWAFWRRTQYVFGLLVTVGIAGASGFLLLYEDKSNCFDAMQNGLETGIDCGGDCVRICAAEVIPPKILWAESFKITEGQYNAVAYIENPNGIAAVERFRYTFQLYNNGALVAERKGESVLPPGSIYPVFEGRIAIQGGEVTETRLLIEPDLVWQPASVGREQFRVANINLTNTDLRPRLDAVIENTALSEASSVEIVATLFNDRGEPITASQTFVDSINPRSEQNIVFTWPNSIAKTVRSCSIPSDIVLAIDLSGSMNSDGDNPPQPLTNAKDAAARFVERLQDEDQVSVVTFATEAEIRTPLTYDHASVISTISNLLITREAEVGYTNTVSALKETLTELQSTRHNNDARKAAILLTDGLPTSQSATTEVLTEEATTIARAITDSNAIFYVIGLGENVDESFLQSLTDEPENVFLALEGGDLDGIYQNITGSLCEVGTAKIEVIAKTRANFTPINAAP